MRILQVVHGYPPQEWGGAELVTATLAQALAERGHGVTVFARTADTTAEEFSLRDDEPDTPADTVRVVRVVNNLSHVSHFRLEYDNQFLNEAFQRVLTDTRPDIVHIQHVAHLSGSLIQIPAQLGYPVILSLHDFFFACYRIHLIDNHTRLCPGPDRGQRCVACLQVETSADEERRRFVYFEQLLHIPQRVIVPSQFLADRMQEIFPFVEPRLHIVAPGIVPVRQIRQEDPQSGPLRVLYIGVLMPHKGPHLLIEATRGLPSGSIAVSLYGSRVDAWRAYADQLETDAADLPIRFCGTYARNELDELSTILAQHDVLVVPSLCEETFSLVTREALQAGLPVIAARRGALPEVIRDGVNGLLFEPENAHDLRRCLERLRTDTRLREQLTPASTPIRDPQAYAQDMEVVYEAVRDKPVEESPHPSPFDWAQDRPLSGGEGRGEKFFAPTTRAVSVCVPTYNGAAFIEEALRSILDQTYQDFELLVVDDGSTDATLDIVQSFSDPRIQVHRNPERLGIPANWNRCLELAGGEFVCLFHQDDVMLPENLECKVQLLSADETVGFVHSGVEALVDESAPSSFANWIEDATEDTVFDGLEYFRTLLLRGNRVCAPTVMARRHALLEQGGFDKDLGFACDYAMWLRLCLTYRVGFLARPLIRYRWHGGNASHIYQFERGVEEIAEAGCRALKLFQDQDSQPEGRVLGEAFSALTKLRRWISELERGRAWQEDQRASWRGVAETQTALIDEFKGWIEELEAGRAWQEDQRASWQELARKREQVLQEQQTWISELERGRVWQEDQRASWQELARKREQVLQEQQTWISELERGRVWQEDQRASWQELARKREQVLQEQQTWISELERGRVWQEDQQAGWQELARKREQVLQEQQTWISELERGRVWQEDQRASWQELARKREQVLQEQQTWISELERGRVWQEDQQAGWQELARKREQVLQEQQTWISELERGRVWQEDQRASWQELARKREQVLQEQQTWISELERGRVWQEDQRASWQELARKREQVLQEQQTWISELERGRVWQEDQRASWRGVAETQTALIDEFKGWIEELEAGRAWLEDQRTAQQTWISELERGRAWQEDQQASWQELARKREQVLQEQQTWISELEQSKAWLEEERTNWQRLAEEREQVLQEQQAWISELEQSKAWLEEQRTNWQTQAEHWQAQTRHWQESLWGRLGTRLKLVKPVQDFPAKRERDD